MASTASKHSSTKVSIALFSRFKKVMINEQPWEVQAVDSISTPGILEVSLKETYSNTIETNIEKAVEEIEAIIVAEKARKERNQHSDW